MAGGAQAEPGAPRVRAAATGSDGCGCGVPRGLGGAAWCPARRGSAGLGGVRRAMRAPRLRGALCSALPLLAGSRAEGGPSYPDVRSPGLSGGGGEAARAAITRETAPSCHEPSVLLLSRGVLGRGGKGAVSPAAPGSHKWAQRALPGPRASDTPTRGGPHAPPTHRTPTPTHALTGAPQRLTASKYPGTPVPAGSLVGHLIHPRASKQGPASNHLVQGQLSPVRPWNEGLSKSPPDLPSSE